nr:hypothetical protein CFP56_18406 [Quercus suber]
MIVASYNFFAGTEIPKSFKFNHQSSGNSIPFRRWYTQTRFTTDFQCTIVNPKSNHHWEFQQKVHSTKFNEKYHVISQKRYNRVTFCQQWFHFLLSARSQRQEYPLL